MKIVFIKKCSDLNRFSVENEKVLIGLREIPPDDVQVEVGDGSHGQDWLVDVGDRLADAVQPAGFANWNLREVRRCRPENK